MPAIMTLGGPLDLSTVLFRGCIIFVGQPINSQIAQRVISQLVTLATIDDKADILVYVNCPGGSTYSVLAIYDCMSWVITKFCSERTPQYAFEYAPLNNRKTVMDVHKENMKLEDGIFLESCREIAKRYPNIKYNEIIVDSCCMQLLSKPEQFNVMFTSMNCSNPLFALIGLRGDFGRLGHDNSTDFFISQPIKALHGLRIRQISFGDDY